jgi:alkaline phosphatase
MPKRNLGRWVLAALAIVMLFSGCAQPTPQVVTKVQTVVVEKERIVEKPVVQTVVVEKEQAVEKQVVQTVVVEKERVVEKPVVQTVIVEREKEPEPTPQKQAKYVILLVGDGMAVAQRNAAELYLAATANRGERPEETRLVMNTLPAQGMNTTYDLTSVIPDSASTGTALATGKKTASGVVSMNADGTTSYQTLAELAKEKGWKVGVISSVSIDHATPATFYAHEPTRGNYYEIDQALVTSEFDLFFGGPLKRPTGDDKDRRDLYEVAEENGFTVAKGADEFRALEPGMGKVFAVPDYKIGGNALYYELDRPADDISLPEYTGKAIELLDNEDGFFLMVEGGKIDWACHANDAAAAIHDTLAFDQAVAEAIAFYEEHPDETLVVVTGDHETGGMTIGFAGTGYSSFFEKVQNQKMSQDAFGAKVRDYRESHTMDNAKLQDLEQEIEDAFGLLMLSEKEVAALKAKAEAGDEDAARKVDMALSEREMEILQEAFVNSMQGEKVRSDTERTYLLYGGYEPLAIKCSTILNQKAGISWTSYSHTGIPVQTSAIGVGAEMFNGYYDNVDIHAKILDIADF